MELYNSCICYDLPNHKKSPVSVSRCRAIRCSGILVGEALMRAADPGAAVRRQRRWYIEEVTGWLGFTSNQCQWGFHRDVASGYD